MLRHGPRHCAGRLDVLVIKLRLRSLSRDVNEGIVGVLRDGVAIATAKRKTVVAGKAKLATADDVHERVRHAEVV